MKITKSNLEIGMKFMIKDSLDCLRYSFDEDGCLEMSPCDYGELKSDIPVTVTGLIKKYRTEAGYSGDMVRFETKGEEYVSFWIDFKNSTNYLENN